MVNLRDKKSDLILILDRQISDEFYRYLRSLYDEVKQNNKKRHLVLKEFQGELKAISQWDFDQKQELWNNVVTNSKRNLNQIIPNIFKITFLLEQDKSFTDFDYPTNIEWCYHCYLNLARHIWKNPDLFYDIGRSKIELQKNILRTEKLITRSIFDTFNEMTWHCVGDEEILSLAPMSTLEGLQQHVPLLTPAESTPCETTFIGEPSQIDLASGAVDGSDVEELENTESLHKDEHSPVISILTEDESAGFSHDRNASDSEQTNKNELPANTSHESLPSAGQLQTSTADDEPKSKTDKDYELSESDIVLDKTMIKPVESYSEHDAADSSVKTDLLLPRVGSTGWASPIMSRENSFESTTSELFPRKEELFPRKEELFPRKEELFPRKEELFPRKEELFPRREELDLDSGIETSSCDEEEDRSPKSGVKVIQINDKNDPEFRNAKAKTTKEDKVYNSVLHESFF